ncbi:MAG: FapA family protein [Oscillospiraceae bacterium]|nr:FapA family protein [Oscillospiraceae bacterium]
MNNSTFKSENTENVDSAIAVQISDDRMTAYLILTAPLDGGQEATLDDVLKEASACSIAAEIDTAAIATTIRDKMYAVRVAIAKGKTPVNGVDGVISYKYECSGALSAKTNERDETDYKDLGLVTNILTGTLIAEITPPTEGEDGADVCGAQHKAIPGREAKFLVGKGTALTPEGDAIVAEIDGNLRWYRDHFTVDEVLILAEDVGAATGNIDFIGDVQIKGNVMEGFTVKSKKNITINGTATNAKIKADGNIEIKMGSVNSQLTAKGGIKVGFCESSVIDCGGDLTSASFVSSEIFCKGTAFAINGKGVIIGGKITCLKGMVFNTVGSESYTKTRLTLGNGAILSEEKFVLEKEEAKLSEQTQKLIQIIDTLNDIKKNKGGIPRDKEDMLATAIRSRFQYSNEIKRINKRIAEIEASFLDNANLMIEVRKTIWPGVSVRIGALQKKIENKSDRCRISIDNSGEITVKAITGSI